MPTTPPILEEELPEVIETPSSRGAPLACGFGFTLLFAGLLTHPLISIVGGLALVLGLVNWFREVLPHELHVALPVEPGDVAVVTPRKHIQVLQVGEMKHRARLPLKIYPYKAGVVGGLVGGAAMAVLACLYGLIGHQSLWYPINLLAASGSARIAAETYEQLRVFDMQGFVLACIIHLSGSALTGLLYGILLPMLPTRPILFGGLVGPLVWTGLLHSTLGIINPTLQAHIDWPWFIASQFAFGIVTGVIVARYEKIHTLQSLPFAVRAGFEAPGLMGEHHGESHEKNE